jgi:predicted GIY-YIG superfamily endonuclease
VPQTLLFPDPRPLVDQLGPDFFQRAPACPGVYLMRDRSNTVLYVGKAKNLRKRLASYRVANPDRLPRRHLRLLRSVTRIELQQCPTESSALDRESELLRQLRPPFNRAGTWPATPRFLTWRVTPAGLHLAVALAVEPGWSFHGPLGAGAIHLRALLVRLCWCALQPARGLAGMPEGWFAGRLPQDIIIPTPADSPALLDESAAHLAALFAGEPDRFADWIRARTNAQSHPFAVSSREADLEALIEHWSTITSSS